MNDTRAVVITGASTGIGAACALRMAARGYRVFAGIRRVEDGEALVAQATGNVTPVHIDVTDADSIRTAADTIGEAAGGVLWGLVNNAGIVVAGPLELLSIEHLRRQLEINVIGQVAVTQALLPMIREARGRIVFMGSIAGRMPTPFVGAYGASKHAMEAVSDALRFELAPWGIQVSLIEPGAFNTPIWKKSEGAALTMMDPARAEALYGAQLKALKKGVGRVAAMAGPVEKVAAVVEHALTASRPRTRYLVGFDARVQALMRGWAPDRWRDFVIRKAMGIPR
jgi:NAD(P)-dependent dehydrogenase (short-subunit alcohol dehydrogenase family)